MRRKISALLLTLSFLFCPVRGQTRLTVSGVVLEQGTGRPVSGAEVDIVGGKANQDVTDSAGKFSLKFSADVTPGTVVHIRVTRQGYETYTDKISISSELSFPISLRKLARVKSPPSSSSQSNSQSPSQLQGKLLPSDEPTPANSCPDFGRDGILILIGFAASYVNQFPHTVVMVDDKPRLVVHRGSDGTIWVSLDIFGADGKIIATLDEDGFTVRPGSYFKLQHDKNSLRIVDEYNLRVLNVRYVNSRAIWINGLLRFPGSNPVALRGSAGGGICTAGAGGAEISIGTKPSAPPASVPAKPPAETPTPSTTETHKVVDDAQVVAQHHEPEDNATATVGHPTAAASGENPAPVVINSAPGGFATSGGTLINPTVNNYGLPQRKLPLSKPERDRMVGQLKAIPYKESFVGVIAEGGDPESATYAHEICKLLRDAEFPNCESVGESWGGSDGVWIQGSLADQGTPPAALTRTYEIFVQNKVPAGFTYSPYPPQGKGQFSIYVGRAREGELGTKEK